MSETLICPSCGLHVVRGPATCPRCKKSLAGAEEAPPAVSRMRVIVTDVDMPFGALVAFFFKCGFAAIPTTVVLAIIWTLVIDGLASLR